MRAEMTCSASIITLTSPALCVQISSLGARLLSVVHQGCECLYGPKTLAEVAADECYCGAICGRVANRIAGGQFMLDGQSYDLAVNNGPNHLHGGLSGFSDKNWAIAQQSDTCVELHYTSPAGEEAYPGCVQVTARYELCGARLSLRLAASTDAPTLLNLTNHAYWNLAGTGSIEEQELQIMASAYTPMVDNIPTGAILPVSSTPFDLRQSTSLGARIGAGQPLPLGYDDNYVLPTTPGLKEVARLTGADRSLVFSTDAPGLQVYTGYYLPLPFGGVALEAQNFPDSPHHAHFPSIELRPGQNYQRELVWEII